jgi:hypothetical protein
MSLMGTGAGLMAKKVGRPRKSGGEGSQVRIDRDLAKMSKAVADREGIKHVDYLSGILRLTVTRDYRRMMQELDQEIGGDDDQPRKAGGK